MDLSFCRTLCSLPRLLRLSHYLLGRVLPPCVYPCSCSCRKHASSNLHMLTPHFPQESAWTTPPLKGPLTNLQVSFSAWQFITTQLHATYLLSIFSRKSVCWEQGLGPFCPLLCPKLLKKYARHCSLVGPQLIKHMRNQRIRTMECYTTFKNNVAPDLPIWKT